MLCGLNSLVKNWMNLAKKWLLKSNLTANSSVAKNKKTSQMTSAHRANMATDHQAYILGETVDQIQKGRTRVGITSHHQTLGSAIRHIWEKTSTKWVSASSFTTSIKAEKGCHLLPSLQNYLILCFMCSHLFIWPSQWPLVFLTHKHPHPYTIRHQKQSN